MSLLRNIIGYPGRRQTEDQVFVSPEAKQANLSQPSSQRTLSTRFPTGVEIWHLCNNATVDICFVHGLTGDLNRTWTVDGEYTPWPKTLLPPKLPTARILTYGYDAYVVRKSVVSSNCLNDHAENLLTDLAHDRIEYKAESRPIIFVAHSLGGLVCKKAILMSRNHPESHLQDIFKSTKGIVFMGTPHKGSWISDWADIPARFLGLVKSTNLNLLQVLQTSDQLLNDIHEEFLKMLRMLEKNKSFEVACFYEEKALIKECIVVSKESATFGGYHRISIDANHRDMVKFSSTEDSGFRRLVGVLSRWEKKVTSLPEQTDGLLHERQAKRSRDSSDEAISKRRRTSSEKDLQQRDHSDDTEYEGSSASEDADFDEENTTEQLSQMFWNGDGSDSEGLEEDTSDGYSRSSEDKEAYVDNLTDGLAPFSQSTIHSTEDSGDEKDW